MTLGRRLEITSAAIPGVELACTERAMRSMARPQSSFAISAALCNKATIARWESSATMLAAGLTLGHRRQWDNHGGILGCRRGGCRERRAGKRLGCSARALMPLLDTPSGTKQALKLSPFENR